MPFQELSIIHSPQTTVHMYDFLERERLLIGEEKLAKLKACTIFVVGVGGVGSWAAELLVRAGLGKIVIMDMDEVKASNANRQIHAMLSNVGKTKTDVMAARLLDINPDLELEAIPEHLEAASVDKYLEALQPDCVVDAIDEKQPKLALLKACVEKKIPVVSSMGAGNKLKPELVKVADISKSYGCPLARSIRKNLHKLGINKGIQVVFSPEEMPEGSVLGEAEDESARRPVGSISFMPAIFGVYCASEAVNLVLQR